MNIVLKEFVPLKDYNKIKSERDKYFSRLDIVIKKHEALEKN